MVYPYVCDNESCSERDKEQCIVKSHTDASRSENCPACHGELRRLYISTRSDQFQEFYDPQYKTWISSARQEKALMKQHGHIEMHDILRKKYPGAAEHARDKDRVAKKKRFSVMMGK